jgi:MFS family permease
MPLLKIHHVSAAQVQLYGAFIASPWTLKPLIGVISDALPIRGYHKRYYLLLAAMIGIASLVAVLFQRSVLAIVICFFGVNFQISVSDLLSEGAYAKLMREKPETGTSIVTLVSAFQLVGVLIALAMVGPLSDIGAFLPIFVTGIVLACTPVLPTLLGWLPEARVTTRTRCCSIDWPEQFALVGATGLAGPALAFVSVFASKVWGVGCALVAMALCIAGAYIVFPKLVGRIALYQVIIGIGRPALGSAMDFFYTASDRCVPGGPAFSYKYYVTYTGVVGAIFQLLATWIYQRWFSTWRFRSVLLMTSVLVGLAGLVDLVIVMRWNVTVLGLSDKATYILGEAIIENAVAMLYWIPSSAIISKVCPPNREATTFAFLAGVTNFASMTSSILGAAVFEAAGIDTTPGQCNFQALPYLILACHILLPLITGISAAVLLVPNVLQDAPIDVEEEEEEDLDID